MPIVPITEHETLLDEYSRFARECLRAHPMIFLAEIDEDQVWVWHPLHERYEYAPRLASRTVYTWVVDHVPATITKGKISPQLVNNILRVIKDHVSLQNNEINPNPDLVLIPTTPDRTKWHLFDFVNRVAIPNTPDSLTLCCEDWCYLPDQTSIPPPYAKLLSLSHTIWDQVRRQQLHRGILTGGLRRYDRLVWLCGFPRTGKGATMALLSAMIGRGNYSNLSCRKMTDKFVGVSLINKRANFSRDDVSAYLEDESAEFIKTMVSFADEQSMRQFFGPERDFKNIAVMVFGSNFLPKLKHTYDHNSIIGKIFLDIYDLKPDRLDPNFVQELVDARDAIASYLINLPDLIDQDFCDELTPSGCGAIAECWRMWSDPIYRILRDVIHKDAADRVYIPRHKEEKLWVAAVIDLVAADPIVDYVQQKLVEIEQGSRKHEYLVQNINEFVQTIGGTAREIQIDGVKRWYYNHITCSVPGADPLYHPPDEEADAKKKAKAAAAQAFDVDVLIQTYNEVPPRV